MILGWLLLLMLLPGCCPAQPAGEPSAAPLRARTLSFIGDVDLEGSLGGLPIGGISALGMRGATLVALSDAHRTTAPSRFYEMTVAIEPFTVAPERMVLLDGPFASGHEDPEGLAIAAGEMLIASEGDGKRAPRLPPSLHRVAFDGTHKGLVEVPAIFSDGARHNKSFEGLTASPSGTRMVLTTEHPLPQDGQPATYEHGSAVRLIVYESLTPTAEYAYMTEPVPRDTRPGEVTRADIGVSALTLLDDTTLLVLERAGVAVEGVFVNDIRIYEVSLSGVDIAGRPYDSVLTKRLLLDLADVVGSLTTKALDNIEAMALGPVLADGRRSLIVASDDNFSERQRTVFIAFAIDE
jgi:hypothetical protein